MTKMHLQFDVVVLASISNTHHSTISGHPFPEQTD